MGTNCMINGVERQHFWQLAACYLMTLLWLVLLNSPFTLEKIFHIVEEAQQGYLTQCNVLYENLLKVKEIIDI